MSPNSIRGSRVGELLARCIVETGTSSFYSAVEEATAEPVLKEICRHIAADEFRHYRMFLNGLRRYQPVERISLLTRLRVVYERVKESDDDELAFAYHCANEFDLAYDHGRCNSLYAALAYRIYRYHHAERAVRHGVQGDRPQSPRLAEPSNHPLGVEEGQRPRRGPGRVGVMPRRKVQFAGGRTSTMPNLVSKSIWAIGKPMPMTRHSSTVVLMEHGRAPCSAR